jgi:hypothetical protein
LPRRMGARFRPSARRPAVRSCGSAFHRSPNARSADSQLARR